MFIHLENAYVSILPTNGEAEGYVLLVLFVGGVRRFSAPVRDDMKVINAWAKKQAKAFGAS